MDGIFATPWVLLSLPGSFLMAGLLNSLYEVGPFWFGLITAMPALANSLQILLIPALAKAMGVRDMALSQSWLNAGLWLSGVLGIAFLPIEDPAVAGLFFTLLFFLCSLSQSLTVIGWMTWVPDFVPLRIRGRYMGVRNRFTNISTLCFMLLSLIVLKWTGADRRAYIIIMGIAAGMRIISIMTLYLIRTKQTDEDALCRDHWFRDIAGLRTNKPLIRFIGIGTLIGFWLAFTGMIAPVYAFSILGATPTAFIGFNIASTLSGIAFLGIWGKLIDRHGAIPVMIITLLSWRVMDFGWVLITPQTLKWMYLIWTVGGIMGTGYLLATFNLMLKLAPKDNRAAGISLNLTATSIAAAIAPMLAGFILNRAKILGWDMVETYRICILIGLIGAIASLLFFIGVKEPETHPDRNTVTGALRSLRNLTVSGGIAFMGSLSLTAPRKRKNK